MDLRGGDTGCAGQAACSLPPSGKDWLKTPSTVSQELPSPPHTRHLSSFESEPRTRSQPTCWRKEQQGISHAGGAVSSPHLTCSIPGSPSLGSTSLPSIAPYTRQCSAPSPLPSPSSLPPTSRDSPGGVPSKDGGVQAEILRLWDKAKVWVPVLSWWSCSSPSRAVSPQHQHHSSEPTRSLRLCPTAPVRGLAVGHQHGCGYLWCNPPFVPQYIQPHKDKKIPETQEGRQTETEREPVCLPAGRHSPLPQRFLIIKLL